LSPLHFILTIYWRLGGFNAGMRKRLNFCGSGSTLKKEAGSGSELRSIRLFEEPETEAFFIKHRAEMWKWKLSS